jgi:hypothetical protein
VEADEVEPGTQPHQGAEFGSAVASCPTITAQPHDIVECEIGNREGKGWVHDGTNIEHLTPPAKLIEKTVVFPHISRPLRRNPALDD